MAGIADLLFGPQTYAVQPQHTENLTSILSGAPAALSAQSQVPGAEAAAQVAPMPAAQEPGLLQKAQGWLQANPMQAQALMQSFGAMASGRTNGNFLMQAGQAASVGNQYMVEQTAANAQRDTTQKQQDTVNQGRMRDDARQDKVADSTIATQEQQRAVSADTLKTSALKRRQDELKFAPEMAKLRAQIDVIKEQIATAQTQRDVAKLTMDKSRLEYDYERKYGDLERQTLLEGKQAQTANYQEQGAQEILKTDAMVQLRDDKATLTPAQRTGVKGAEGKALDEMALSLINQNPEAYTDPKTNQLDIIRARRDAEMLKDPSKGPKKRTAADVKAERDAAPIGGDYVGLDGITYTKKAK